MAAHHLLTLCILTTLVSLHTTAEHYDRFMVLEGATGQVVEASKLAQHYGSLGEVLGKKNKLIEDEADIYGVVAGVDKIMKEWASTFVLSKLLKQKPPQEAIKLFTSLPRGIVQCDYQGYLILASNYAAAVGNSPTLEPTDQIRSSVLAAIKAHGQICRQEYYERFTNSYNDLKDNLGVIERLLHHELLGEIFPDDLRGSLRTTNLLASFKKNWATSLLKGIVAMVRESSDSKFLEHIESEVFLSGKKSTFETEIIDKYLFASCRLLVHELADIFEPARLDLSLEDNHIHELDPNHSVLLIDTWKRYLVCNMFNLNSSIVGRELTNLARRNL